MDDLVAAVTATATPLVLGGTVERLHLFLEPIQPFRDRVKLKRSAIVEQLASRHAAVLRQMRDSTSDEPLRGFVYAPQGSDPDTIGAFTSESFRLYSVFNRLELLSLLVRAAHGLLLFTTVLGLVGVVLAFIAPPARAALIYSGLAVAGLQVLAISTVYFSARKLDAYEDIT